MVFVVVPLVFVVGCCLDTSINSIAIVVRSVMIIMKTCRTNEETSTNTTNTDNDNDDDNDGGNHNNKNNNSNKKQ